MSATTPTNITIKKPAAKIVKKSVKKAAIKKPAVTDLLSFPKDTKAPAVKKAPAKKVVKKAVKSTMKKPSNTSSKEVQTETKAKAPSKMELAVIIVNEMFKDYSDGKVKTGDILKRLMSEAKLSKAGSSTYFHKIKKQILADEL